MGSSNALQQRTRTTELNCVSEAEDQRSPDLALGGKLLDLSMRAYSHYQSLPRIQTVRCDLCNAPSPAVINHFAIVHDDQRTS